MVNKDDQHLPLLKRGAVDRTNNAIDRAQAKVERVNDKVTGVGHVLSDHLGMKDLRKDLKAAWHPEQNVGNHHQKRGLNDKIDRAQAKVTGIHDRVQNVKGVVKDHAKNNGFVRDLSAAWHPEHQKRSEIVFIKREEHPKINANWGYGNPHHKRESISIDQVLGRSQSHRSHHQLIKRDLVDSANRAIDQAQDDITDKRNKVHAVKEVVDQHFKNDPLVNDVKQAWDSGNANV